MRKTKLQLIGAMLLSCCLLAATPVSSHTLITSYAAGSEVSYQLDITPTVTTNVNTHISDKIQDALNTNDVVTVVGNATLTDTNSNESININIPQGKKVIWKATITSSNVTYPILALDSATNDAEFELAGGKLTSDVQPALISKLNSHLNVKITGGDIYMPHHTSEHGVLLRGHGNFDMSGGSIISYSGNRQALYIISNSATAAKINIQGGVIFATGNKNTNSVTEPNGNSAISIEVPGTQPEINIDANKATIVTWDKETYNINLPRYVGGDYDNRHLKVYEGSSTRLSWSKGNDGRAAVSYVKQNGERGMINSIPAGADDIDFPSLPSNPVYDKTEKGVDNITSPQGEAINFEYTGVNSTNYPSSTIKPVNAGEYEVTTTLSATYGELNVSLGILKINKRAVTVKVPNQTIDKGSALPPLPQSFTDFTVEGLANGDGNQDALSSVPTFSWGTDGHHAGTFAVRTATPIAYTDNYTAAANAITGVLTVVDNTNPGTNPGNPGTNPGNPGTNPSNPGTNPSNPGTNPSNPGTNPSNPGTNPSNPGTNPSNPGTNPSNPGTNPSNPGTNPSNPGTNPKATPSNPDKQDTPNKPNNNSSGNGGSGRSGGSGKSGGSGSSGRKKAKAVTKPANGDWMQDSKGWWYKQHDGSYPKNTWLQLSYNNKSNWYYFDEQGYMQTGWKLVNGKWYYMYENTEGGNTKGAMAASTTINGYRVDASGAWIQ